MKSVTIRDAQGVVLVRAVERKKGFEVKVINAISHMLEIEIRDNDNRKVYLREND